MRIRARKLHHGGGGELAASLPAIPHPSAAPGHLAHPLVGVDVHVADLHLAHLVLAKEIGDTALGLPLRESDRIVEMSWSAEVSLIVDGMIVARHLAVSALDVALLHASAAWPQNASSKPGLRFRLVEGGQAAEAGQVLLHHRHLWLKLPVTRQFGEVYKVGSLLRSGARFGKLREEITAEEAVKGEDGDAQAAAGDGEQSREEFDLGAGGDVIKRGGGSEAGEHQQEQVEQAGGEEGESLRPR